MVLPKTSIPDRFRGHRCAERNEGNNVKWTVSSNNKGRPTKPAGGTLLCLRESQNIAYRATEAESFHQYYIDSGATSHYVNDVDHSYIKKYANSSAAVHTFTFVVTLIGTLPHHFPVSSLLKGLAAYRLKGHSFSISNCL